MFFQSPQFEVHQKAITVGQFYALYCLPFHSQSQAGGMTHVMFKYIFSCGYIFRIFLEKQMTLFS